MSTIWIQINKWWLATTAIYTSIFTYIFDKQLQLDPSQGATTRLVLRSTAQHHIKKDHSVPPVDCLHDGGVGALLQRRRGCTSACHVRKVERRYSYNKASTDCYHLVWWLCWYGRYCRYLSIWCGRSVVVRPSCVAVCGAGQLSHRRICQVIWMRT